MHSFQMLDSVFRLQSYAKYYLILLFLFSQKGHIYLFNFMFLSLQMISPVQKHLSSSHVAETDLIITQAITTVLKFEAVEKPFIQVVLSTPVLPFPMPCQSLLYKIKCFISFSILKCLIITHDMYFEYIELGF